VVDVPRDAETARVEGGGGLALDGWLVRHGCDHGDTEAVFALDPGEPPEPEAAEPEADPDVPTPVDGGAPDAGR
jgi:hypothetical protein